jgi:ABC-type cobalamin/Fe3+-siderophores transport system ATPase subunit
VERSLATCRGVEVRRSGRLLLGPLDLVIGRGEFWGVVGPNGAGKTTLLRVLAGLERIAAGERDLGLPRQAIGLLFQEHDYLPDVPFSVRDVVAFGCAGGVPVGPTPRRLQEGEVDRALALLGLGALDRRLYRELSGGERQKVQLARLLAQQAQLLLLDEPSAGLDLDWQERLTALVAEVYARSGAAVVMVTHDVDRLPACCGRVLLLRAGRPLAVGTPAEVLTAGRLSELYGCRMEVGEQAGRYHAHSLGPS